MAVLPARSKQRVEVQIASDSGEFFRREFSRRGVSKFEYSIADRGKTYIPIIETIRDYDKYLIREAGIEDEFH